MKPGMLLFVVVGGVDGSRWKRHGPLLKKE
jgi:hypothetical protein